MGLAPMHPWPAGLPACANGDDGLAGGTQAVFIAADTANTQNTMTLHRDLLRRMFDAAVAAAQPQHCLPPHLPPRPRGRTWVVGAGKAAAAMARAVEDHWDSPLEGLVITRHGHAVPCRRIEVLEAAHPVPDAAGLVATQRMVERLRGCGPDDLVIALISGGGSALMVAPAAGLSLHDKQALNAALLASGATIAEINCVRRHLSTTKGGRLAALCHPARVVTLAMSDVPGDSPLDIASGPTVADPTTCADALAILARYRIALPEAARQALAEGRTETPKPGDARLAHADFRLIATPLRSLEAAAEVARAAGYAPCILGDSLEGEARELGRAMAGIARHAALHTTSPFKRPCVLLSGGETTVTLRGEPGRGGRNVEFLLSLGLALNGLPHASALAADTDGVDGIEDIAGAFLSPDTLARARAAGLDARRSLDGHDAHRFFQALGDSLVTGPTLTNVNDFRAIVIDGPADMPNEALPR